MTTHFSILASYSILPGWFVLPLAALTALVISWHLIEMQNTDMPASRKRIRTANGLLMLLVTGLLAYALGVMPSGNVSAHTLAQTREFVMVWAVIMGLMPIVIGLAVLDAVNNIRLHHLYKMRLRAQLGAKLAGDLVVRSRARDGETVLSAPASAPRPSPQSRKDDSHGSAA